MTSVRNEPIPRYLSEVRRASCVSAALEWAKQGHQKRLDRDQNTGQFTIPAMFAGMDSPVSTSLTQTDLGQAEQEFTQDERASMADVSEITQQRSDHYEKAGLGPEIRSGAISGAEAERRARDPDAPKPPSQRQQLEIKLEAKVLECQTEHLPLIDSLQRELRCDRNLDQVVFWGAIPIHNTLLKYDDKAPGGAESVGMTEPRIYDMTGSYPDRKPAKLFLTRLDLDLNRLWCVELQVVESLGNETVNDKFSRRQP